MKLQNYVKNTQEAGKELENIYVISKIAKSTTRSITRDEFGNLLEDFKTNLLSTLGTHVETLKTRKRQEEHDQLLSIVCPKCREKHPLKECPLDSIQICGLCTRNHSTDDFLRLKEL